MFAHLSQIPVISGQPKLNFEAMKHEIQNAVKQGISLIVFPEMALPGYFNGDLWEQEDFLKDCEFYHEKIRLLSKKIHIVFGSVGIDWNAKNEDGHVRKYNCLLHAFDEKWSINSKTGFAFWPKSLMPNYRYFDDSRHFFDLRKLAYERNCRIEDLYEPLSLHDGQKNWVVGVSVCEDAWSDCYGISPIELFAQKFKHDFFVNLSCSPFSKGKQDKRDQVFARLSNAIQCPIYYVNCTGVQNVGKTILGFDGASTLYEPEKATRMGDFFGFDKNHFPQGIHALQIALESILKQCCQQWGISRVVIGASGGIDSALSAVLFTKVLGKENVFLINMPSKYNSELTQKAAWKLANNLGCAYASVGIEQSCQWTKSQLEHLDFENTEIKPVLTGLVLENIQARDRGGRILAAVAASLNAAFTCNANKTETTVGYCTLYGDQAGFLCPIADLWKHEVYALAAHYNDIVFQTEIIPKETLTVVPSAELSFEQNVLEGKGDPLHYPYHDFLFAAWVEHWNRKTPADCLKAYRAKTLEQLIGCAPGLIDTLFANEAAFLSDMERWWNAYQGAAFKRIQAPPIVALSGRSFGSDHRDFIGKPHYSSAYSK